MQHSIDFVYLFLLNTIYGVCLIKLVYFAINTLIAIETWYKLTSTTALSLVKTLDGAKM